MTNESPTVSVRDLRKNFYDESRGEVKAVDGVTFSCQAGEVFGLLGANGAGKTTTLRMLSTVLKPTGGSASVMGHDVLAEPEAVRQSLGFGAGVVLNRLLGFVLIPLYTHVLPASHYGVLAILMVAELVLQSYDSS